MRYLSTNPDLSHIQKQKGIIPGSIQFKTEMNQDQSSNIVMEFSGTDSYFTETKNWDTNRPTTLFKNCQLPMQHQGFKQLLHTGFFLSEGIGVDSIHRPLNIWTANSFSAVSLKALPGLSRHETQELAFMFSKKALFLPALLSHLHTNHAHLLERDFQRLVYQALFSGSTLADSLRCFPEVGDKLVEKMMSLVDLYQKLGNFQVQFFLLDLLDQMSLHLCVPLTQVRQKLAEVVKAVEDTNIGNKHLKALGYAQLLASYHDQSSFTAAEVKKLSVAYFYVKAYGYHENLSYPHIKLQMEEVVHRLTDTDTFRDVNIQNAIVKDISKKIYHKKKCQWEKEGAFFCDKKHAYRIDMEAFSLYKGKNLIGGLPAQIVSQPSFRHLFEGKNFFVHESMPGTHEFWIKSCGKKEHFQLFFSESNGKLVIQKEIEGVWHTYLSHEDLHSKMLMVKSNFCFRVNRLAI